MTLRADKMRPQKKSNSSKIPDNLNDLPRDGQTLLPDVQRFILNRKQLYRIFSNTQKALKDVNHLNVIPFQTETLEAISRLKEGSLKPPSIVVLGAARARLVNFLLDEKEDLLPSINKPKGWRWLRIRYGLERRVRLSLDVESKVAEPWSFLFMNASWSQIPNKDLRRNDSLDLQTVMDIEIDNTFLKNGLQILVPPDLGDLSLDTQSPYKFMQQTTLKDYATFYTKRSCLLESVCPIVLYALDEICPTESDEMEKDNSKNTENYETNVGECSKFYLNRNNDKEVDSVTESFESLGITFESKGKMADNLENNLMSDLEDAMKFLYDDQNSRLTNLSKEDLFDLRQMYDIHPNVKIFTVLFSNSSERASLSRLKLPLSLNTNNKGSFSSINLFDNTSMSRSYDIKTSGLVSPELSASPMSNHSEISEEINELMQDCESLENIKTDKNVQEQLNFLNKLMHQINIMSYTEKKANAHFSIINDLEMDDDNNEISDAKSIPPLKLSSPKILSRKEFLTLFYGYAKDFLQSCILEDCDKINEIHHTLLQQFILSSFDMAREMQIIPKKIEYVVKMEEQLYTTLLNKFTDGEKREELLTIMHTVLKDIKSDINNLDWANAESPYHNSNECINMEKSKSVFYEIPDVTEDQNIPSSTSSESETQLFNIKEYDVIVLEQETAANIFEVRRNSEVSGSSQNMSFKQASLEVQKAVLSRISQNISIKLLQFVDCLRDSYFGTLQRCLNSLEEGKGSKLAARKKFLASEAVKEILFVTRSIDLQQCASFSFFNGLIDSLKRLFQKLTPSSRNNNSCCVQSVRWKRQVALDTVESLNAAKLAKLISNQVCEKIRLFHEQFQLAIGFLTNVLDSHLQQTEELKLNLRKLHAPKFARLYLESTSLGDTVRYGLPHMGKELGRGQYGIVFSVKGGRWGNHSPCAVKSVVPPDERHFNELSMEFLQTRNIPPHDRIVELYGCVIDHSYLGSNPKVLLISQRLKYDLHCGLSQGNLSFYQRMQISVDIVEGIRYLHSQGLVHRDIKTKNVLLDENNRAKLTDLGFCLPEAMMSGSIVGTPVHMAPELFSGEYDASVDVYAFGILFWYLCSGSVRLPLTFEQYPNKEQLWLQVRKGSRPERLLEFSDLCWNLMERCWATNPSDRPLLGIVQPVLENIRDKSAND